jgi:hypothetical protein
MKMNRSAMKAGRIVVLWLGIGILCCVIAAAAERVNGKTTKGREQSEVAASARRKRIIPVELADPVFESNPVRAYPVVQRSDANGEPTDYSLLIKTEVCMDGKCKVVEATMHWDALGYYRRLEFDPKKPLTKKEHTPFAKADYTKLDSILRDRSSVLGTHSLAFLAKPVPDVNEADVLYDALSGATPTTVQQAVVKDAAYTTWAMWRWANGEMVQELRRLTEKQFTPRYLNRILRSDDRRHVDYALKYVVKHHGSDERYLESVFYILENGDREHVSLSLRFVSGVLTDKEVLHKRLIESFCRMSSLYNPMILERLSAESELPATTLEALTARLDGLPYFQVHLVLRMIEKKKFWSKQVESDLSQLLDNDNFFIARRVNEFLLKQELGEEAAQKLKTFREYNKNRL